MKTPSNKDELCPVKDKTLDNPDSKTSDVSEEIRVSEHDDRMTMRINSGLKRAILRHCRAKGLSICHINDGLWIGYLRGWNEKIELDVKSPTLNVTVVRDVKRVRRYAVEETVEESETVSLNCHYCKRNPVGMFRYVKTKKLYPLCEFHKGEYVDGKSWEAIDSVR
jgi:hypothetical protein